MADETWHDMIPADAVVAVDGKNVPLRELPFVKESPDLGHFVNKAVGVQREVGARVPVKKLESPEAVAQWRKDNLPKFYDAGLLDRPIADHKEYGITRPDAIPDGLLWDDARAEKFAKVLQKYNVPKSAVSDFMDLHVDALLAGKKALQTDYDTAILSLKREFGDKYDERIEQSKRLTKAIFKDGDLAFLEETGLDNHPRLLGILMRLAPLAQADSSVMPPDGGGTGGVTPESARSELVDIATNKSNPKHEGYLRADKAVMDYIDELYKKAHGTAQVVI